MRRVISVSGCRLAVWGVLCATLSLGPASCAKIESRDLIREGNAAYNDGRYDEAIEAYSKSIDLEPDGVTVFWNRACAAEAMVLKLKGESPDERHGYADMALGDFQKWLQRVPEKTPEDDKLVNNHRLTLLDADERCDDLLQYWFDKHKAEPKEENWYAVIAKQHEKCEQPDKTHEWYVKRTEDFPDSVRAWHALAVREFDPLWPDPETTLPYNENVSASDRIKLADKVIGLLDKATAIDPKFRDAYIWRSMAITQKQNARIVVPEPELPEERLEAILAREDAMDAWKQQKAVCDLEGTPECPEGKSQLPDGQLCCPNPPLSAADQAADKEAKVEIEAEMAAAMQAAKDEANKKKKKKRGRGR